VISLTNIPFCDKVMSLFNNR